MNKTTQKILLRYVLAPILLLVFLWLVYRQIQSRGNLLNEWEHFRQQLQTKDWIWIIIVIPLAPFNWLCEALKWQILLKRIETIPLKRAFSSVLSGIAFAFVTPNKTGDFLGRILYLKPKSRLRGAIAAMIGSLAQIVVTFAFGLAGMIYLHFSHPATWTLTILLVAGTGLFLLLYFYIHIKWLARLAEKFPKLRRLVIAFYLLKRYSRKELWQVLGMAFLRFCIYNGQFLILLYAFNSAIPVIPAFLLSGLMFWLITVIPTFFVADIGVRGFVTGLVFINTGIATNPFSVLAASYLLWIINLAIPAIAGGLLAGIKGTKWEHN